MSRKAAVAVVDENVGDGEMRLRQILPNPWSALPPIAAAKAPHAEFRLGIDRSQCCGKSFLILSGIWRKALH
jgi:hypothetical protein